MRLFAFDLALVAQQPRNAQKFLAGKEVAENGDLHVLDFPDRGIKSV